MALLAVLLFSHFLLFSVTIDFSLYLSYSLVTGAGAPSIMKGEDYLWNIPEPPSFERVQNDYSQKQIDLLNEIKTVQQDQAKLLNQMEKASSKDKKWLVISTISSVIAAIGTIIGIVIPLF